MVIRRGEIWWASMPEPRGSEPGYRRPVLIVQSDKFNGSVLKTVLAAVITSNVRLAAAPGNIMLRKGECHLPRDSVINVSQLVTLNKSRLFDRVGRISSLRVREVDDGLRLALSP